MGDDRRDAEAELRVAVAISVTAPLLLALGYGLLGDLYLQQGDAPEAQTSFDKALVAAAPAHARVRSLDAWWAWSRNASRSSTNASRSALLIPPAP